VWLRSPPEKTGRQKSGIVYVGLAIMVAGDVDLGV
jgi:hypothetical protein